MFEEYSPDLVGHFGRFLRGMVAGDDFLRFGTFQVRADIVDDAVGIGLSRQERDDRMVRDRRVDRDPVERGQDRTVRPKTGDRVDR